MNKKWPPCSAAILRYAWVAIYVVIGIGIAQAVSAAAWVAWLLAGAAGNAFGVAEGERHDRP